MGYDGWVVVGTKLDTKQLEKDLKASKQKLRDYEREAEKLSKAKVKAEIDLKPYEEEKKLLRERTQEDLRSTKNSAQKAMFLEVEQKGLERINNKYTNQIANLEQINQKIAENAKNQSLVAEEIKEMNSNLARTKGFESVNTSIEKVGKSTSKVIKNVARWSLAIFGIRSAYMFVRNAMATLSQYNEQLATDFEYIRFALASMLQPLIEKMIQLTYKLLTYINYIAQAWFGVDLFANASADAMKRGAGSAEKMKKSLAGFDEMNVLNDNGTTGAMGGIPSVDLSLQDTDVPGWIKWIAENKDELIAGLLGIAGALTAIHFGANLLLGLGIGVALAGIVYTITSLLDYLKDPTWENFGQIIQGIGIAIIGIGIAIGGVPAIVIGAIVLIFGTIIKYWEQIKATLQSGIDWLKSKSDWIRDIFGNVAGDIFDTFVENLQLILNWFDFTFGNIKSNFDEIIKFIKNVFAGDWASAWQNIKNIFSNIWEQIKQTALSFGKVIGNSIGVILKTVVNSFLGLIENMLNKPIKTINSLIGIVNKLPGIKIGTLPTFNLPRLAVGGIVNMPGKGVPVGGAIAGEVSKEGVIPLTNSQAMQELGQTIGRYITINANITNTMNGRVISRELQKINTNSDFATNR